MCLEKDKEERVIQHFQRISALIAQCCEAAAKKVQVGDFSLFSFPGVKKTILGLFSSLG